MIDFISASGALLFLALMAVGVLALIGLFLWAFVDSGAWKPVVGFLIAATVIAAISIGIRESR